MFLEVIKPKKQLSNLSYISVLIFTHLQFTSLIINDIKIHFYKKRPASEETGR
jgi:hypothetical protein